jgi:hypothetical protein
MPEARVGFVVLPQVKADANVYGAAILSYEKEVDLISEPLAPIILGPLVFVPVADVTALLEGGASGEFETGVNGTATFETSVYVSSKQTQGPQFQRPVLRDISFGSNPTTVTLHAEAKIGVGARLNVLLYGVTRPYATARAYAAVEGDILETPCWNLHAGLEADLGIKVTTPALPIIGAVTLADWRAPTVNPLDVEVATGACEAPPEQSTLPPGSGPDAMRLANPTYVPWSRTFTSPVRGFVAGPESALMALRLRPDGTIVYAKRYLACPAAQDAIPSAAIVGPQGEVTLAGSGGAQHLDRLRCRVGDRAAAGRFRARLLDDRERRRHRDGAGHRPDAERRGDVGTGDTRRRAADGAVDRRQRLRLRGRPDSPTATPVPGSTHSSGTPCPP